MNEDELKKEICKYVYKTFRTRFNSNRDFALSCGIDEKTVRLIQQEKYNMSIGLLKKICDAQNVKISDIFLAIGS